MSDDHFSHHHAKCTPLDCHGQDLGWQDREFQAKRSERTILLKFPQIFDSLIHL
jgi:hypothetical protein